ncbi:MAG: hypothetical protein RLN62_01830 [Rickettsiales bacterium]
MAINYAGFAGPIAAIIGGFIKPIAEDLPIAGSKLIDTPFGVAWIGATAFCEGVSGWYAADYFDNQNEPNQMWLDATIAAGGVVTAAALYVAPTLYRSEVSAPTYQHLVKEHWGLVQLAFSLPLAQFVPFDESNPYIIKAVYGAFEFLDWHSYLMPLGVSAYHINNMISGFWGDASPAPTEDYDYEEVVQTPSGTKTITRPKAAHFHLNIQNCNNCTFVTAGENKVEEGFVVTKETLLELAAQLAANITGEVAPAANDTVIEA